MKLLERYSKSLSTIKNPQLVSLMVCVEVFDWNEKNLNNIDPEKTIVVGQNVPIEQVAKTLLVCGGNHFVQEEQPNFQYDLITSILFLRQPEKLLKNFKPMLITSLRNLVSNESNTRNLSLEFK